jgi:hypothetical protein
VADLAEAQRRTETQLESLTARTHDLANGQQRILDDLGTLKGRDLERMYREKAEAYFDTVVRNPRVLSSTDIRALLDEATRRGTLAPGEQRELIRADLIILGTHPETGATLYLVVEVSWGIRSADVERAARRAALLRKLGLQVFAVVASEGMAPEVRHEAADKGVWQVIDGTAFSPSPTM